MTAVALRPTLHEQMTRAVHAGNLSEAETAEQIRHLERVAALGIVAGKELQKRLGALLLRLDAGDHRVRKEASIVLASWLATRREVLRHWHMRQGHGLLIKFATLIVLEWEHRTCRSCGGARTVPMAADRANPRGWRRHCADCSGSGATRRDGVARATAMGLSFEVYKRHWEKRFDDAHGWLSCIDVEGDLRRQLSRGTVRPQQ